MKAVLLAGGKGTRLKPYTVSFPKPLVPVGDRPIMEIVVEKLAKEGFNEIILSIGHLAELIQSFFGDGSKWGVDITYSRESTPLGTAGPLKLIENKLDEPFLFMNGDILTDMGLAKVIKFNRDRGGIATIATVERKEHIDYGVVESNEEGRIVGWDEKPIIPFQVSTGIYALDPRAIDYIPANQHFDLPELVKKLVAHGERVYAYPFKGYWLDIGRSGDYEKACRDVETMKGRF